MKKQIVFAIAFAAFCMNMGTADARTEDSSTQQGGPMKSGCPYAETNAQGNWNQIPGQKMYPRTPAQNHEPAPKKIVQGRANT